MRVSYRSALTSGVVALTATAVVAAPAISPVAQPVSEKATVSVPVQKTAASTPWRLPSPLGEDSAIKLIVPSAAKALPQPPAPAASPDPASRALATNPSTGLIMNVYNALEPWVAWGFDVAQWAVGWVPWIGWFAGQIGVLYDAGEVLVRSWFQAAQDLVNLNLANIPPTLVNGVTGGIRTLVRGELNWLFGWLPPAPPGFPTRSAVESGPDDILTVSSTAVSPVSEVLSQLSEQAKSAIDHVGELFGPRTSVTAAAPTTALPLVGSLGAEAQKISAEFEGLSKKLTEQLDPSRLLTGERTKALFSRDNEDRLPTLRGLRTAVNEKLAKTTERLGARIDTVTTKLTESFTPKKDGRPKGFTPKTKIGEAAQGAARSVATKLSSLKPAPKQRDSETS